MGDVVVSSDPYELRLYQMFQSCDLEQKGLLNEEALRRLCSLLELRDKGTILIKSLPSNEVSFENFKEALLSFLGSELDKVEQENASQQQSQLNVKMNGNGVGDCGGFIEEQVLVISDDVETYFDSPPESSDREVTPKLIVGTKKYGRRSRPPHAINSDDCSLSDSEDNTINDDDVAAKQYNSLNGSCNGVKNHLVQRCSSQTDIPATRRRRAPTLNGSKLKRCSSLPGHRNVNNNNITKLSAGIHKDKLNGLKNTKKSQLESSLESLADTPALLETLPSQSIIEIWERAHVPNARNILLSLGFDDDEINLDQLNKVLEEDLRGLEDEPQMNLLRAALALQTAELNVFRQTCRQMQDENSKLKSDNKDANRRATSMAVEIDELHATLEDSSKKEIRLLEQRHATMIRDLTTRMANDRENWINQTSRLEDRIKNFELDEIKFKTDLELVRKENESLEVEQQKLQKQITDLLERNIELNQQIACFEDKSPEPTSSLNKSLSNAPDEEMMRLIEKVTGLQMENTNLRDKNDELTTEIENLNLEKRCLTVKLKKNKSGDDVDAESSLSSINSQDRVELKTLSEELQQSQKSNQEASEEIYNLKLKILDLEVDLDLSKASTSSVATLEERCKELDSSLEQMQRAYEECEDYWQNKLSEERQMFEKERQIYEEEQQESDKKFTELMEKVREYEEQFSKDGRLASIDERDDLEQQYLDMETELEEIRSKASQLLEEKEKEIDALQLDVSDLKVRLGESVEILTGAQELNDEAVKRAARDATSPASSPINYLWQQSTIQQPATALTLKASEVTASSPKKMQSINLSTSETAIFSTVPIEICSGDSPSCSTTITPIQKPSTALNALINKPSSQHSEGDLNDTETCSNASVKSVDARSVSSQSNNKTSVNQRNVTNSSPSPSSMKEELKRLKFFELTLKEQIQDLSLERDGLVMELQQLQEAKPVLQKSYARTAHPNLIQRANQLELKNRHLQNVIKQQQHYTEQIIQQTWRQHQIELNELRNRIENQNHLITEQTHRLQNADILVNDLYVENSRLTASVKLLEQQRARANMLTQQQQRLSGLPGMP